MSTELLALIVALVALIGQAAQLVRERRKSERDAGLAAEAQRKVLVDRRIEATILQAEVMFRTNDLVYRYQKLLDRVLYLEDSADFVPSVAFLDLRHVLTSAVNDYVKNNADAHAAHSVLADRRLMLDKDLKHFDDTIAQLRLALLALEKNGTEARLTEMTKSIANFETLSGRGDR